MTKIKIIIQSLNSFQLISVILWVSLIFAIPLVVLLYRPLKKIIFKTKSIDLESHEKPKGKGFK